MPKFGSASLKNLGTCQNDLQILAKEVVKTYDCACIFGHRTPEQQHKLFEQGRTQIGGVWTVTSPIDIVTQCDGFEILSAHNQFPSHAMDLAPCINGKISWDKCQCYHFNGFVTGVAEMLLHQGKMQHRIRSGADWDSDRDVNDQKLRDLVHFEIIM